MKAGFNRESLLELERRVASDLSRVEGLPGGWVPQRTATGVEALLDVVIVGAGLSGLSIGFGLKRQGIHNVVLIDRSPKGHEGPWVTSARMDTLRSFKQLSGPDLGVPSLTFRSWHEATHGPEAWDAVGKIPRQDWMDYLVWYRDMVDLDVRNETALTAIAPWEDHLALDLATPDGPRRLHTRKIVLATGIEGSGGPSIPDTVLSLPRERWTHSSEVIDTSCLAGRDVGIIGAAASAFDWAVAALRAGAASATLFAREAELPRTEVLAWTNFPGFLGHFADLDDLRRWRFMRRFFDLKMPPTAEMFAAAHAFPNFRMILGSPMRQAQVRDDRIHLDTPGGAFVFDHLLLGTGYTIDLKRRPELTAFVDDIALWADRFTPPIGEGDATIARCPYLGRAFEFTERHPGSAPFLADIHVFNNGALPSLGPVCNGITGLKYGVRRIVEALTRSLFLADADTHYARLMAYDEPHFRSDLMTR